MLEATLREYGVATPVAEVYAAVWHRIDEVASSFEVVAALRGAGYGVHLATNQERHRGTYMHDVLGYRDRFDVSAYSWEVGAAKPDPEFFHRVVRRIGAPAGEVLFVDDNEANVARARRPRASSPSTGTSSAARVPGGAAGGARGTRTGRWRRTVRPWCGSLLGALVAFFACPASCSSGGGASDPDGLMESDAPGVPGLGEAPVRVHHRMGPSARPRRGR